MHNVDSYTFIQTFPLKALLMLARLKYFRHSVNISPGR